MLLEVQTLYLILLSSIGIINSCVIFLHTALTVGIIVYLVKKSNQKN